MVDPIDQAEALRVAHATMVAENDVHKKRAIELEARNKRNQDQIKQLTSDLKETTQNYMEHKKRAKASKAKQAEQLLELEEEKKKLEAELEATREENEKTIITMQEEF